MDWLALFLIYGGLLTVVALPFIVVIALLFFLIK